MSQASRSGSQLGVRLGMPERRQMGWVAQCADDLVEPEHPVRLVAEVVEKLYLGRFYERIQAREGVAWGDAADQRILVALWL
jgi:hypothetical protein